MVKDNIIKAFTSSKSTEWITPQWLYDLLDDEFHFTLDPCANSINAKCKRFFTSADDGLSKSWLGERVFMNPPYGDYVPLWVAKAYTEVQKAREYQKEHSGMCDTMVVGLLPARTDSKWFHEWVSRANEVRLIKGRIKFIDGTIMEETNSPLFPSMIVLWESGDSCKTAIYRYMDKKGNVWRMNVWGEKDFIREEKKV
jgi:site-specific DNA-methyltransferase (adenine-specific)